MHPDWLVPTWNAPGVGAVMTTRRGGFSAAPFDSMNLRAGLGDDEKAVQRNQALFAQVIGATPVYLKQSHGANVVRLVPADAKSDAPVHEADAAVTTEKDIACTVQVADCLPVLLAGPGVVGAAHAGWRGLAGGGAAACGGRGAPLPRCVSTGARVGAPPSPPEDVQREREGKHPVREERKYRARHGAIGAGGFRAGHHERDVDPRDCDEVHAV